MLQGATGPPAQTRAGHASPAAAAPMSTWYFVVGASARMAAEMLTVAGATKMDRISVLMMGRGSVMNSGAQNKFIRTGPGVRT